MWFKLTSWSFHTLHSVPQCWLLPGLERQRNWGLFFVTFGPFLWHTKSQTHPLKIFLYAWELLFYLSFAKWDIDRKACVWNKASNTNSRTYWFTACFCSEGFLKLMIPESVSADFILQNRNYLAYFVFSNFWFLYSERKLHYMPSK